jgi:hypothetical protein
MTTTRDQIESTLRKGGVFTNNQVRNVMAVMESAISAAVQQERALCADEVEKATLALTDAMAERDQAQQQLRSAVLDADDFERDLGDMQQRAEAWKDAHTRVAAEKALLSSMLREMARRATGYRRLVDTLTTQRQEARAQRDQWQRLATEAYEHGLATQQDLAALRAAAERAVSDSQTPVDTKVDGQPTRDQVAEEWARAWDGVDRTPDCVNAARWCNCQAIPGTPNYPAPWHPVGNSGADCARAGISSATASDLPVSANLADHSLTVEPAWGQGRPLQGGESGDDNAR